mgnify:CR=1 FL=1
MARAKSFGIAFDLRVTPAEAQRIAPILRTDDLAGAVWIPGDGKANPTDLTQSLAKGARMRGAAIFEGVKVTGVRMARRSRRRHRLAARRRRRRDRLRDARQLRAASGRANSDALAGVNVPLLFSRTFLHRHQGDSPASRRACRSSAIRTASSITRRKSAAS